MGCSSSSSKGATDAVKGVATSEKVQTAVTKAVAVVTGGSNDDDPHETNMKKTVAEQNDTHKALHQYADRTVAHREQVEGTRRETSSPASAQHQPQPASSRDRRHEPIIDLIDVEQPNSPAAAASPPRGTITEHQKDALRHRGGGGGGFVASSASSGTFEGRTPLGGGGGSHHRVPSGVPQEEQHSAHVTPRAHAAADNNNSSAAGSPHADRLLVDMAALRELVLAARHDRDVAQAEAKRLAGERDHARADAVYLRATADATDNFQDPFRIPPHWVPSEHQLITELRERVAHLERDAVLLKHQARRHASTAHVNLYHEASFTTSPSTPLPPPFPVSPSELAASVRDLQGQVSRYAQEASTLEAHHRTTREQLERDTEQLRQKLHRTSSDLQSQTTAASKQLAEVQQQLVAAQRQRDLQDAEAAKVKQEEETARAAVEQLKAEAVTLRSEMKELQSEKAVAAQAAAAQAAATNATSERFLQQLALTIVPSEHCTDAIRLQLLQYVCEQSGHPVPGLPSVVSDATEFDMNGILYGDCIAQLASLVIQRPENRVEALILSETEMSDLGVAYLALTIAVLPFETPLRRINVCNNDITSAGAMQLLTSLIPAPCGGGGRGGGGGSSGGGGCAKFTNKLVVDLDNNPLFQTVEDVRMIMMQVEALKHQNPLVDVELPRVPAALAEAAKAMFGAGLGRTASVFRGGPL